MTETRLTAGGIFTPSLALISADQETILGDGTSSNPLRLSSSGDDGFLVGTLSGADAGDIGAAVYVSSSIGGFTFSKTANGSLLTSQSVGVVSEFNALTDEVTIATTGIVTLTTAQWDVHTGQSGGLTPGSIYYANSSGGALTVTQPATPTQFVAQVGIGFSATRMILSTPSFPEEVL